MLDRSPKPPDRQARRRERQRRYRQRQADGRMVVPVEIDGEIINRLIAWNWLRRDDADDKRKLGVAIGRLLEDAARHR